MRLAIVDSAPVDTLGGIERAFADLAVRARARGHDVRAVGRPGSHFVAHLRALGVPALELPLRSDVDPRSLSGLARLYRELKPDAVIGTLNRDARLAGLARGFSRLPAIALLKGLPMMKSSWQHVFTYRHFVDGILAPTSWMKAEVERYPFVRHLPVPVLPDGIDDASFPPMGALVTARAAARAEHAVPPGRAVFMSVGHLIARKNFAFALDALARLPRGADFEYWIAGDGPEEAALRSKAEGAGLAERVRLLGRREDVARLLLCADALLVPSLLEQLPLAVLEARRAGVPHCLVAPVGAVKEMRELGAALLPVDDAGAWAEALGPALRAPGATLVPRDWRRDAETTVGLRLDFLARLAEGRRARR